MKTLKDVKPGQTVTIVKLHGEGAVTSICSQSAFRKESS